MPSPAEKRSYVARYYQLMLDGSEPAGIVKSVEYGGTKGELLAQPVGGMPWKTKHIHNPTNDPFTIQIGMSMSKDFFAWVAKSWAGQVERKNGSVITYDADLKPMFEYVFKNALILETTVPALDATSNENGYLTVKIQAEEVENHFDPGGSAIQPVTPSRQKLWSPSNFRFDIDHLSGYDARRVNKIDQFVVKQNVKPVSTGPDWMYQIEPTSLEYPNLAVTFSMVSAKPWFDWHKEFVQGGKNMAKNEKTGAITLYSQDLKTELLSIDLRSLGLVNLAMEKSDATNAQVRRVKAEMYCEEMIFNFKG